jgi:hypothetical protein
MMTTVHNAEYPLLLTKIFMKTNVSSHTWRINAFKSERFEVIEKLTLSKVNALKCFHS